MKKLLSVLSLTILVLAGTITNAEESADAHTVDFGSYEKNILTQQEIDAIVHMREEEKMARDLYRELSETTNSRVFVNIPVSEQRHMDAFSQLIGRYGLEDPVADESARGVFTDPFFTELYQELIAKGKKSNMDAFQVGAMVEDLNMANLIKYNSETDKEDLTLVYDTLLEQSKHHMSAFIRNLDKQGVTYTPEHITQEQLESAVSSGQKHMQEEAEEGGKMALEIEQELASEKNKEPSSLWQRIKYFFVNLFS